MKTQLIYNDEKFKIILSIDIFIYFSEKFMQSLEMSMNNLRQIWDRIGIGKSAKCERSGTVLRHLQVGILNS